MYSKISYPKPCILFTYILAYLKHFLVERVEELVGGGGEVETALVVVHLERLEVVEEDVGVLLVHDAVRAQEHVVEAALRLVQQGVHIV